MTRFQDLTGKVFGTLTVIGLHSKGNGPTRWWCRCSCGQEKAVLAQRLKSHARPSCGCAIRRKVYPGPATLGRHGLTNTPEHRIWLGMLQRCFDPSVKRYQDYGGRGISVHRTWLAFEAFLADMGRRPSPFHTLDRFPNRDGNYEPGNCRWATAREQARNTRANRRITCGDRTMTLVEWSEETGIKASTIARRIDGLGWDAEDAITTPSGFRPKAMTDDQAVEAARLHKEGVGYMALAQKYDVSAMTVWSYVRQVK